VSALVWGVKASLLDYVRGMPDGAVAVDGAIESADGFTFPSAPGPDDGILRFRGSVTLTGHSGMMRVVIADPWVAVDSRELSIADPDDKTGRLTFARFVALASDGEQTLRAQGTTLTADGSDLFFGPYREGTTLDDPVVTA